MFTEPPKAPVPLVEVPAPRWNWSDPTVDARSGVSYQQTEWVSASFIGTPFMVTLMRVASVPRTRIEVPPMPVPASEVATTEGMVCSSQGMS